MDEEIHDTLQELEDIRRLVSSDAWTTFFEPRVKRLRCKTSIGKCDHQPSCAPLRITDVINNCDELIAEYYSDEDYYKNYETRQEYENRKDISDYACHQTLFDSDLITAY